MILTVKVFPKAKLNKVTKIDEAHFQIHTTAAPDKGKANAAVIKLLAKNLALPQSSLNIVKGRGSRRKLIEI